MGGQDDQDYLANTMLPYVGLRIRIAMDLGGAPGEKGDIITVKEDNLMRKKDKRADKNAKETVSGSLRSQDDFEREEASFYPPLHQDQDRRDNPDSPEYEENTSDHLYMVANIAPLQGGKKCFTSWEPRFLGQYFAADSVTHGPAGAL